MKGLTFCGVDVETANVDRASICQIGIVHVRDGVIFDEWETLINPKTHFDLRNVEIHGIEESDVQEAPTLEDVQQEIRRRLEKSVVVSHSSFDRIALERAMGRDKFQQMQVKWLDSTRIVRRAWPTKYAERGYRLSNLVSDFKLCPDCEREERDGHCQHLHNALVDARMMSAVVRRASEHTELDIAGWLQRVEQPINPSRHKGRALDGNPEGPLYGQSVVFTGELKTLNVSQDEGKELAAQLGCDVQKGGVTKKTTLLVVGIPPSERLKGYNKTSKHRKAEDYIKKGQKIDIISEEDFAILVKNFLDSNST